MAKHIEEEHALCVMFNHGNRKKLLNPKEIEKYDVVITTYDSVSSEFWKAKNPKEAVRKEGYDSSKFRGNHLTNSCSIFSINWRRVVLDEGHQIRNPASKRAVAAWHLTAQSRWVLSGNFILLAIPAPANIRFRNPDR
jgi:SWI/SNF-related matrix-associated actin-dependent regulator of chromatin subfamily A3